MNDGNCAAVSMISAGDLSSKQFQFCNVDEDRKIGTDADVTAAGAVDGIIGEAVDAADKDVPMVIAPGVTKIKCGAQLAAGALVSTDATGKAVAATQGDVVLGRLLEAASGDGSIVDFLFLGNSHLLP